jgi:thiol-disulfide isomerase/thioredoxin
LLNNKAASAIIVLSFILMGFMNSAKQQKLKTGVWRMVFDIGAAEVPVLLNVTNEAVFVINGAEKIKIDEIQYVGDSVFMKLPIYDTEIRAKFRKDGFTGNWYNHARSSKKIIPVKATYSVEKRFESSNSANVNLTGNWEIDFISTDASGQTNSKKALGVFSQVGSIITGSILTPTGDYRFLEGIVEGNELKMSSFSGASLYYFTATIEKDGFKGLFFSGIHHQEKWQGVKNQSYKLPDAETLTKQSQTVPVAFSFPGLDQQVFSFPNPALKGKVVILQLMGSWCPNCLDETILLNQWHQQYQTKGLEIIALAFELTDDFQKSKQSLERLKTRIEADYTFLIAGKSDKQKASEKLPFLDKVMAFPTTVFIDKKGEVRKIHTGFSGPATGAAYETFVVETSAFLEMLMEEE